MSEVKLTADSGGGTVAWKAPATTTSNAAVTLTLPQNDGDASQYLQTNGSGALTWATVSVGGASNIAFNNGNGIDFSASEGGSATGDSVLNDYETGTWTPTMTGGYTSITYADQKGRYLKIGNLVYAQFRVGFTGTSRGGDYAIGVGPLPFTPSNWTGEQPAGGTLIHCNIDSFQDGYAHWPYITGGDAASVSFTDSETGSSTRAGSNITSNKYIQGQFIYSTGLS